MFKIPESLYGRALISLRFSPSVFIVEKKRGIYKFAAKCPPASIPLFFENFPVPLAFTESASDKNARAREILRPLDPVSALFRALWCRQFEDPGGRGTAWFSRDR